MKKDDEKKDVEPSVHGSRFNNDVVAKARVVLGAAAAVPWRSKEVEDVIIGKRLDADIIATAAEAAIRQAQPLQYNDYKIPLFRGMIEEELLAIRKTG
ncbi:MAG: hypothetical protein ACM30F_01110 [Nitrospirota bacterium]